MSTLSPLGPLGEERDRVLHQGIDFHITVVHCLHFYVTYKEAIAAGLSVIEYSRRSKAATEMLAFFAELKEVLR